MPVPQLIEVKKYPNRRLYDSTRSQHLTHEELYELVVAGHTVRVTESKSGADITSLVLMQALIEHNPEKFSSFPPELVHLLIRASEQMLRGFASNWFTHTMASMMNQQAAAAAGPQAASPAGNPMTAFFPWMNTGPTWGVPGTGVGTGASSSPPPTPANTPRDEAATVDDLEARLAAMMDEIQRLKGTRGAS